MTIKKLKRLPALIVTWYPKRHMLPKILREPMHPQPDRAPPSYNFIFFLITVL